MREKIIGRKKECERLDDCMREKTAQLVIVYGRRRVGKTFLINEYFNDEFAFKLTGAFGQSRSNQLRNFTAELRRKSGKKWIVPKDWIEAFEDLREYISTLDHVEKQVIFFDEMPWLDTHKSGFLSAFEFFWNDWGSSQDYIVFIVCGSATAWMVDRIADNKGGLFNRQTCRLYLEPFKLFEVEAYLESKDILWSRYEIAQCYMIMGGVPYYLNLLTPRLSFSQNIDRLFFENRGELWDEFDHLYNTLFSNSEGYIAVVEALSRKRSGMTREEIAKQSGIPATGTLTKIVDNLVSSGFIRVSRFYHQKKKKALYQLADYYTAFYFRFIRDNYGKDEHYWSNTVDNPSRRAWSGLAFEQLCKDHIAQIKHRLGISGVLTEESVWYTQGDPEEGIPGAQIDLVMERRDRVVNLCEMKFSVNEFVIDKAYDRSLRNKLEAFRRLAEGRQSLQITMVTTYGVRRNKYSSLVQSQVVLDDLFHE